MDWIWDGVSDSINLDQTFQCFKNTTIPLSEEVQKDLKDFKQWHPNIILQYVDDI